MIGDRIKEVRLHAGMSQVEFGSRLKLSQSAVANYEKNVRTPIDSIINSICKEFNVSESWLRTGEGKPFVEKTRDQQIEDMVNEIMASKPEDFRRRFIRSLTALNMEGWKAIERFIDTINEQKAEAAPPLPPAAGDLTPDEHEVLRQYREKKNQDDESSRRLIARIDPADEDA